MDFSSAFGVGGFRRDAWESITDQPPNPHPYSPVMSDTEDDDEWIRDPTFDALDRVVIM